MNPERHTFRKFPPAEVWFATAKTRVIHQQELPPGKFTPLPHPAAAQMAVY
jgi:hypothetical protein